MSRVPTPLKMLNQRSKTKKEFPRINKDKYLLVHLLITIFKRSSPFISSWVFVEVIGKKFTLEVYPIIVRTYNREKFTLEVRTSFTIENVIIMIQEKGDYKDRLQMLLDGQYLEYKKNLFNFNIRNNWTLHLTGQ